jgi:cytochrome c peroxidase
VKYLTIVIASLAVGVLALADTFGWSDAELTTLRSMWIKSLPETPNDPTNRVVKDQRAIQLGHKLFFDARLSGDGEISCGSCHKPTSGFADNNALAEGEGTTTRNAPSIVGAAYNHAQFWDGRADSLWSQALGPLEASKEHGTNRLHVLRVVALKYKAQYEALFGALPSVANEDQPVETMEASNVQAVWNKLSPEEQRAINTAFSNIGKTLAAYETQLKPGSTRFDAYLSTILENGDPSGLLALSADEIAGLRLFIGKAGCVQCHSGARLTDDGFHNTGVPVNVDLGTPDEGRAAGLTRWYENEFNCLSAFNDAPGRCAPFDFARVKELSATGLGAFKTPSLRNLAQTAPYMHAGQFSTLTKVVEHYLAAPIAPIGKSELRPLQLTNREVEQLVAFLETLKSEPNAPVGLLNPPK